MAVLEPKLAHSRRDRLGARHRRAAHRRRRREQAQAPGQRDDRRHALSASAQLHRPRLRARARQRAHREVGRQGARARARGEGLRLGHRARRERWRDRSRTVDGRSTRRSRANGGATAPAWLRDAAARRRSTRFAALGFPTTKNEDWHFTSVAPIAEQDVRAARGADAATSSAAQLAPFTFGASDWHTLVFVNGRFDAGALGRAARCRRACACCRSRARVRRRARARRADSAQIASVRRARVHGAQHGVHARRRRGAHRAGRRGRRRRSICSSSPTRSRRRAMMHPRNLIVARPQREGDGDRELRRRSATRCTSRTRSPRSSVGDGATLHALQDAARSRRARIHVGTIDARQARDSHYVSFSLRDRRARSRARTSTRARRRGLRRDAQRPVHGRRRAALRPPDAASMHAQPNCFSRELYKGILDGRSHGVFNGKVYVHPIAQKTDGKQTNNTLLLSEHGADRHQAAARDLRRRREVHARRDGRPARRDGALLPEEPRHRARDTRARAADVRVRRRRARDDRAGRGARGARGARRCERLRREPRRLERWRTCRSSTRRSSSSTTGGRELSA